MGEQQFDSNCFMEGSFFIHSADDNNTYSAELTSTGGPVTYTPCYRYTYPPHYPYQQYYLVVENRIEKAFKIAKMLIKDDYVHFSSVEKFIKLVENLKETL